jgi:hypothetical protein
MAQITLNTTGVASNGSLVLQSNGTTTAVTIDTSQNVGIGTGSPLGKLQVKGANPQIFMEDSAGGTNGKFTAIGTSNGNMTFNRYLDNGTLFGQFMTLDASGNLSIGATSTTGRLLAAGTGFNILGNAYGVASFLQDTTTARGVFMGYDSTGQIGTVSASSNGAASNLAFWTYSGSAWGERARIDSSGNLVVGATSTNQSHRLVGKAQNAWTTEFFAPWASNNYGISVNYTAAAPNTTGFWFYYAGDTGGQRFGVASNGGIYNYSANNSNLSDRREKTNFAPAKSYLDVICAIPVQTFNYIDQNMEDDGGLTLGVVAQDVQAIAPELVMESDWAKEGDEPKMRLSIYQTDLQYALMKCIQELKAEIDSLKSQLNGA